MSVRVLVIDDDEAFRAVLARGLRRRGFEVDEAGDAAAALQAARRAPARIVLDLKLGADNGLNLIAGLLELAPGARIVLGTGYASIATAVDAIRRGAWNYLPKPFDLDTLERAFAAPVDDTPVAATPVSPPALRRLEWEHIQRVLHEHGGNVSEAARALGLHRRTLQRKLAKRPVRET